MKSEVALEGYEEGYEQQWTLLDGRVKSFTSRQISSRCHHLFALD